MSARAAADAEPRAGELRQSREAGVGPWMARVALDSGAPAAARGVVADVLAERVPASVLHDALLIVSELAANSVRHSGVGPDGELMLSVRLDDAAVCIEVHDRGVSGVPALRDPAPDGGGLGLHILQALSEAWGMERDAVVGTRVWARIAIPAIPFPR